MTNRAWMVGAVLALLAGVAPAAAQSLPDPEALSLEAALRLAEGESEQVTMAQAALLRARGQQLQARSEWLPQVGAMASYTRTLASEFQGAAGPDTARAPRPAPCDPFSPSPSQPLAERVGALERALECESNADPLAALSGLFRNLPFGRENQYRLGLSVSQNLFAGGRIAAQNRVANAGRTTAELALEQARAQLALEVTQAYYDALLSDRLLGIAESTLEQAEATLRLAALARQVGSQPEFELLRAQVTRDNQRPVVIQRRSERELAYLRLRQLLNLPADRSLRLTSDLGDAELTPAAQTAARLVAREGAPGIDTAAVRAVVRQAEEAVRVQEGLQEVAESQRLPSLVLSSQYGRVAYPVGGLPTWGDTRENWTVTLGLQVPLFTGGRIRGDRLIAQAGVLEARARLQQARELAALDTRSAYEQLAAALAAYQASQGTVQQAVRAHQIAEVRYREGISTQVELSDARILLEQAQANRAMTARNLQVARVRVALLPKLPLGAGGLPGGVGGAQQPGVPQQQAPRRQAPPQQAASASSTGIPGMGGQ